MTKSMLKIGVVVLLGIAVAGMPVQLQAQTNDKPAVEKKETKKKPRVMPFRGTLKALDKTAKTITVGKRTFQITSETRIFKGKEPGTFEDGVVGKPVSGGFYEGEDGKLLTTKVTFGKVESTKKKATKSKEEKSEDAEM